MIFKPNRLLLLGGQALSGLVLLACVIFFVINADRGFELTDYSYYLLWAQQPANVVASHFPFGHITQVLYHLSGGNIALFRVSGVLLFVLAAWFLTRSYGQWRGQGFHHSLFLLLCATVLMFYHGWLHVPSYNWLAVLSVMLVLAGLLVAPQPRSVLWVALGGVLAFYAKPTTAALLGLLALCWILLAHFKPQHKWRWLMFTGVLALLLLWASAQWFFGSSLNFFTHLSDGVEFAASLQAKHTISEILTNTQSQITTSVQWMFRQDLTRWWFGFYFVAYGLLWWLVRRRMAMVDLAQAWIQGGLLAGALLILLTNTYNNRFVGHHFYLLYFMVLALWLADVVWHRRRPHAGPSPRAWWWIGLASFLVLLSSLAPSLGTNNHIVRHASMSVVLMALAVFVLLDHFRQQAFARWAAGAFALSAVLALLLVLQRAYEGPYRMPVTIASHHTPVQFVDPSKRLRVDAATAQYLNSLMALAKQGGWVAGTPMIDLTGGSPGALVVLDAQLVGTTWLIGGYKGSDVYVGHYLAHSDPQTLRKAWVLTSPQGRRQVSDGLLPRLGLAFPENYQLLGQVRTAQSNEDQLLWKPK